MNQEQNLGKFKHREQELDLIWSRTNNSVWLKLQKENGTSSSVEVGIAKNEDAAKQLAQKWSSKNKYDIT